MYAIIGNAAKIKACVWSINSGETPKANAKGAAKPITANHNFLLVNFFILISPSKN